MDGLSVLGIVSTLYPCSLCGISMQLNLLHQYQLGTLEGDRNSDNKIATVLQEQYRLSHNCSLLPSLFLIISISPGGSIALCSLCHGLLLATLGEADSLTGTWSSSPCYMLPHPHTKVKSNVAQTLVTLAVEKLQPYYEFSVLRNTDYSKDMFIQPVFQMSEPSNRRIAKHSP